MAILKRVHISFNYAGDFVNLALDGAGSLYGTREARFHCTAELPSDAFSVLTRRQMAASPEEQIASHAALMASGCFHMLISF